MYKKFMLMLALMLFASACTLVGEVVPLTPTPDLPGVTINYPANNAQVYEGTDLTIEILATDNTLGINRVELYVDSLTDMEPTNSAEPLDADAVPAFAVNMNWLAQGLGRHTITVVAYRADGLQSDERTIVVEVIERE